MESTLEFADWDSLKDALERHLELKMLRMIYQALTGTNLVHEYPDRCIDTLRTTAIRHLPQRLVDIM